MSAEIDEAATSGLCLTVRGVVQGVGFRPWVYRLAVQTGVTGRVRNGPRGVTIDAFGTPETLRSFLGRLRAEPPPAAHIEALSASPLPGPAPAHFSIDASSSEGPRRLTIGPDLATCPACVAELHDPRDRRHRYAFTNCTACGPRLSIAEDVPYDRETTTMVAFPMCPDCAAEYESVTDRRFHAEPNACPRCGPRLRWWAPELTGEPAAEPDPLQAAAHALQRGAVVLVKGLGGYHLACDATDRLAVARLRERKAREEKPFAVMVGSLRDAEAIALLTPAERSLLESVERPIVLLRRHPAPTRWTLADGVAPDAPRLGLMLPYTPLHHLLLEAVERPLVMTSANLSDEPTVFRDADAALLAGRVADGVLDHDRRIALRVDDSIATVIAGAPMLLRRSRGFTPRAIALSAPVPEPILACGAQLKSSFCIAVDDAAYFGPHIGDLDRLASYESFCETVDRFESMLAVHPTRVAHDLHPDLLATRYARSRPGTRVGVQHHHAHIAAVMAEHGVEGPALGVAYDGVGLGTDGTAWGGEILLARREGFTRVAALRPIRIAGGDRAVREPWRLALALLDDAFEGRPPLDRLALFRAIPEARVAALRAVLAAPGLAPPAHGAGRYFDAVAAIVLARPSASYEAQLAMALEHAVADGAHAPYPFEVRTLGDRAELDLRAALRDLVDELLAGVPTGVLAARFHHTLAAATARVVLASAPDLPVVLSGGCFQNAALTAAVLSRLGSRRVLLPRQAPPNDGGIALGQIWVASAAATTDNTELGAE